MYLNRAQRRLEVFLQNTTSNRFAYSGKIFKIKIIANIQGSLSTASTVVQVVIKDESNPCYLEELWAPEIQDQYIATYNEYGEVPATPILFPRFRVSNPKCDAQY